jgi:hypothetical protein
MAEDGEILVMAKMLSKNNGSGRRDINLFIDGSSMTKHSLVTPPSGSDGWGMNNLFWAGPLTAGAHTVSIRGDTANSYGCGSGWGDITTLVIE